MDFFVVAIRLIVPFTILRWPFAGMLAAFLADATDVIILDAAGQGFFAKFGQQIDKALDAYYLSFAAYMLQNWQNKLTKRTAIILFLWRIAGILIFEITKFAKVFFFTPNIFENFYLLVTGAKKFFPKFYPSTTMRLIIFLAIAGIPKIIQEYFMHFLEFQTWAFVKHNIFRWR